MFDLYELNDTGVLNSLEYVHHLTVDITDLSIDKELTSIVQGCPQLQELDILVLEGHVFEQAMRALEMLRNRPSAFRLALLERGHDGQGRIIAEVAINDRTCTSQGSTLSIQGSNDDHASSQTQTLCTPACEG